MGPVSTCTLALLFILNKLHLISILMSQDYLGIQVLQLQPHACDLLAQLIHLLLVARHLLRQLSLQVAPRAAQTRPCACVCARACVHAYVCVCVRVHACMRACVFLCVCMRVCACVRAHACVGVRACMLAILSQPCSLTDSIKLHSPKKHKMIRVLLPVQPLVHVHGLGMGYTCMDERPYHSLRVLHL